MRVGSSARPGKTARLAPTGVDLRSTFARISVSCKTRVSKLHLTERLLFERGENRVKGPKSRSPVPEVKTGIEAKTVDPEQNEGTLGTRVVFEVSYDRELSEF